MLRWVSCTSGNQRKAGSPSPVPNSCPCVPPFLKNRAPSSHGGDGGSLGSIRCILAVYLPTSSLQALTFFPVTPRGEFLPEGTSVSHHSETLVPLAQKAQQGSDTQSRLPLSTLRWSREQVWWLCQSPITCQVSVPSIATIAQIFIVYHPQVLPAPHPQHCSKANTWSLSQQTRRVSPSHHPTLRPLAYITALPPAFLPFTGVDNCGPFFFFLFFPIC